MATIVATVRGMANLPIFLGRVCYHVFFDIPLRRKYGKTIIRQVSDISIGVGALVFGGGMVFVVFSMSFFTGLQVGMQGYPGLQRIGVESFTGVIASFANAREAPPITAGGALIARGGGAFTAEIGAMRISEEIDALEVMGINSL